mmetsp:Transcript_10358/g.21302  ORF Transcript_10358/g.21302 Transcript_10358/m.21302 type:complete len:230 (-) Transcript_10358:1076-1765(-)
MSRVTCRSRASWSRGWSRVSCSEVLQNALRHLVAHAESEADAMALDARDSMPHLCPLVNFEHVDLFAGVSEFVPLATVVLHVQSSLSAGHGTAHHVCPQNTHPPSAMPPYDDNTNTHHITSHRSQHRRPATTSSPRDTDLHAGKPSHTHRPEITTSCSLNVFPHTNNTHEHCTQHALSASIRIPHTTCTALTNNSQSKAKHSHITCIAMGQWRESSGGGAGRGSAGEAT